MLAPNLLIEPESDKPLPKAVSIDQLQIFRLQGRLQLQPESRPTSAVSKEDQIKHALSVLQSVLKESGQKVLVVTNKAKTSDAAQYFELVLTSQALKLCQWNQMTKFETQYGFDTLKLVVNNKETSVPEDLEKFANKIRAISTSIEEKKADVIGRAA